jgi:citronellol/citronellal dehydrogenase
MVVQKSLSGKVLVMSGGSRGIGLAIGLRAAQDGAKVAIIAKTEEPHPKLEGTIHSAAEEIRAAGGQALPIAGDVRDDERVLAAVQQVVDQFGGIDICVNNASAIDLSPVESIAMKRYDLMQDVNTRGTFVLTKACLPHLKLAANPHVLTLSPPLNLNPAWLGKGLGYSIAKYGMSLCTLGFAEEFKEYAIAANSLWPRTTIATAAVRNLLGGDDAMRRSRDPRVVADAAHAILTRPSRECTGRFFIDDEVLAEEGITDLSIYGGVEGELQTDLFLD